MSNRDLQDRIVFITGAARGIGRGIAERLIADGAGVVISDLDEAAALETADELETGGAKVIAVQADVSSEVSVLAAIAKVHQEMGAVSVLINNAGLFASTPALSEDLSGWQKSLDVMLTGSLLCARATAPDMKANGWGRIVNISSVMAFIAYGEDVGYCTAKAGLLGLTRSLAVEFGKHNINVNAICPGHIRTPMLDATAKHVEQRDGTSPEEFFEELVGTIPKGRLAEVKDIAAMVSFLCSEDADHVTGQAMHVNGGSYLG
ncbi:SDR family oxidoreductase [Opitutia bacterium ISCC 51]|nr:SDR family oxidoreductase [Opitutae bacterium ISCC 51]QXD29219.1 SDR family oxidoreductase [Opitutae bacterium ISCC 52]